MVHMTHLRPARCRISPILSFRARCQVVVSFRSSLQVHDNKGDCKPHNISVVW